MPLALECSTCHTSASKAKLVDATFEAFDRRKMEKRCVPFNHSASVEARVVLLAATVAQFPPVRLAFAWAKQDTIPVILGQVNFFMEFDICFFRSRALFEVKPKA